MTEPLQLAGIAVRAVSVAGLETCIELPSWRVCFDIGRGHRQTVRNNTVLFTHAHIDHMGGIAHHVATRGLLNMKPPTYVVPKAIADDVEHLLDAFRRLDGSDLSANIVGLEPGESLPLGQGMLVKPLRAFHRVPCQGYALVEVRKHLRPDLVGQGREVIMEARERGEEIHAISEHPKVVFSGDTKIEFLEHNPMAQEADLLIMEVSFVDDRVSVQSARTNGHIHIDEVVERADLFKNKAILFTHLSARYRFQEALDALDAKLPQSLRERVTLLPRPEWCQ